ncbi:unnamed protein product [Rotaria socialis]|uniref:Uncharacterized protein n=2 Tax=Rotaria socialis TaxID=392032 RepID=A0A821T965_9BILA|nr:unnamed protein product [Rotaria socialis]
MAPKKTKEYSNDLREVVIKHFLNGNNEREIAQNALIPRTSVHYMIQKYKSTKCIGNIIGRGRKRKTTSHTDRIIQRKIKVDRRLSSTSIKAQLKLNLNLQFLKQKFVGVLMKSVYTVALLGENHMSTRLTVAKDLNMLITYRKKPLGFWNSVLWSDESKFNLFGSDGKHGGGNVKRWRCFSASGVGNSVIIDGNMTGELYRDILQKTLLQSVKKLNMNNDWYFQHANDPKHRASIVTNWLDRERIQRLIWPFK